MLRFFHQILFLAGLVLPLGILAAHFEEPEPKIQVSYIFFPDEPLPDPYYGVGPLQRVPWAGVTRGQKFRVRSGFETEIFRLAEEI
jgi:hypothetical protein